MSAIRTSQSRGAERNKRSSPYAFALVAKIGRYLGLGSWVEPRAEDSRRKSPPPANAVSPHPVRRHHLSTPRSKALGQPSDNLPRNDVHDDIFTASYDRPPLTPVRNSNAPMSNGHPATNDVDGVASYLSMHIGQPVSPAELQGFLNTLSKTPQCQEERFRFSSANPSRESPPASHGTSPSATPRKTLSRNPNGVYRWEGAGSAKNARRRNRYASPAFGASPSKPERVVMKESTSLTEPEGKRRRLDEAVTAAASQPTSPPKVVPFPSNGPPATPRANGIANKPPAPPPSARLRTPAKPTAPVKPSPLRQAWSDASSASSHNDRQSPSQLTKQSKTADFMAELIKETTPPKRPDLSNPYQTASPVGKVGPPRRATKRPRATGRPAAPATPAQDEQGKNNNKEPAETAKPSLKDISPQAVIEATVPKGSKRSRPPANFGTASSPSTSSRTSPPAQLEAPVVIKTKEITCMVEEPDEEEDQGARRAAKRAKPTLNGLGPAPASQTATPQPEIIIEEIEDVVTTSTEKGKGKAMEQPTPLVPGATASSGNIASPTPRSSFSGFKSIPKEPSKLRYSIQLDRGSPLPSAHSAAPSAASVDAGLPVPPSTSDFKTTPPSSDFTFTAPKTSVGTNKVETKESKQELTGSKQAGSGSSLHENAKLKALDIDVAYLPTFVFISTMTPALSSSSLHVRARNNAQALPDVSLPTYNFASGTVTDAPPVPSAGASSASSSIWGAKTPTSSSANSSTLSPAVPVKGFDFAAAGMKPPPTNINTWTCPLCAIKNLTSTDICQACETPNPLSSNKTASESTPTPVPATPTPVQGFNWAAAGMKAPTVSQDKWTCSLCGLANPKSANQCETCETPQ